MRENGLAGLVGVLRRGPGHAGEGEGEPTGRRVIGGGSGGADLVQRVGTGDLHVARGDGARLVQAEHVHAGERLDAVELLREHLLAGEADSGDREDRGGEEHQALGDHAQKSPHRGEDGRARHAAGEHLRGEPRQEPARVPRTALELGRARPEQPDADGDHEHAREPHDAVQRVHDLGVDLLDVLGLGVDLGHVVLGAHVLNAGEDQAGVEEAARHEMVARLLADEVALASEEALVHARLARDHHGVGGDLVAAAELHEVVLHDLLEVELDLDAVADDHGLLGSEERELIHHALGTKRLYDADSRVQHHDAQKADVLPRARGKHQEGEDEVDEVKDGEEVLSEELPDRFGLDARVDVDLARGDALLDLCGGETARFPYRFRHGSSDGAVPEPR